MEEEKNEREEKEKQEENKYDEDVPELEEEEERENDGGSEKTAQKERTYSNGRADSPGEFRPIRREEDSPGLLAKDTGVFGMLDTFMKNPSTIFNSIRETRQVALMFFGMLGFSVVFCALYGLAMGSYAGLLQALYSAAKLPMVFVAAYVITLPSFYVFGAIAGARFSLKQAATMLMTNISGASVILLGVSPVVFFFSISTSGEVFILVLHFFAIIIATVFGLTFLWRSHAFLKKYSGGLTSGNPLVSVWITLYIFILCQLLNYLRPFMDKGDFFTGKRELFIEGFRGLFR